MKIIRRITILFYLQTFTFCISAQQNFFPELHGTYLGQTLPSAQPVVFAPGIISTPDHNEFCASFSPDGKEFYFNRGMTIMVCCLEKHGWTVPKPASFNGVYNNHEAHLAFDNKRLFFGGSRPPQPYGLWLTERTDSGWSEPQRLADGMYVTSAENGNIYFGTETSEGTFIVQTKLADNQLLPSVVQNIGFSDSSVTNTILFHPAIAPDDSYLVFDNNEKLFVCFRHNDGSWGLAISLNKYIDAKNATIPSITPDGKFLFFALQNDLYWISTDIIQDLKSENK
jgi:Tol biopolymer transport system component